MPSDSTEYPLDKWLSSVQNCQLLKEEEFKMLCDLAREYLMEESNVQSVSSPVNICGDIHGQFYDLLKLFQVNGEIAESNANYIFMGDYVDRGHHSLETITYLLILKCKYPDRITLLRGNHESRQITQQYGFYDEIQQKYGNFNAYKYICDVFDWLPLAALVDNRVLCVHGGISPDATTIDSIRTIKRKQEIPCASREEFLSLTPQERSFADLMWSDPEEDIVDNWAPNPRGVGWVFGKIPVAKFNQNNGLELICRSHQLAEEGFKYMFDEQLVTIWSAPNYCYRCGNDAAVLQLDDKLNRTFEVFNESPLSTPKNRTTSAYFL